MDDLLVYIARELVNNPDEVNVKKTERGNTIVFELHEGEVPQRR